MFRTFVGFLLAGIVIHQVSVILKNHYTNMADQESPTGDAETQALEGEQPMSPETQPMSQESGGTDDDQGEGKPGEVTKDDALESMEVDLSSPESKAEEETKGDEQSLSKEEIPTTPEKATAEGSKDEEKTETIAGNNEEMAKGDERESMEVVPQSPESRADDEKEKDAHGETDPEEQPMSQGSAIVGGAEEESSTSQKAEAAAVDEKEVVQEDAGKSMDVDESSQDSREDKSATEATDQESETDQKAEKPSNEIKDTSDDGDEKQEEMKKEGDDSDKKPESKENAKELEKNKAEGKVEEQQAKKEEESLEEKYRKHLEYMEQRRDEERSKHTFPDTLEEFKYKFNEDGELRHMETDEKFIFHVKKDDHVYNQKRYEALGEIITDYVYNLLEKDEKLQKVYIPVDAAKDEPKSFIFMTEDALTNPDKLMLLIHGSGVVRAGQWARSLIININLESGTQIPYIRRAKENGYGVIVFNTNENYEDRQKKIPIRENSTPEDHTQYVWDNFVMKSKAKHVVMVAHSYGGLCVTSLCASREKEFYRKVTVVAMTESIHSLHLQEAPHPMIRWFSKFAVNWVTSEEPCDTPIPMDLLEVPKRSAGTKKHEETSWKSIDAVFKYFAEAVSKATPSGTERPHENAENEGAADPNGKEKKDSKAGPTEKKPEGKVQQQSD
ncbi:cotranscriptional regulator ARB2A homolog [Ptychodera flava]|uniref:cotranscriptional regulator ARB2A homolog n=1 Tax=Ptychodera flava TaxID=63121 RepID=UPI00396A6704